jgi:hypothetical protein
MSSASSKAQEAPGPAISSNFDLRIHVVGGNREVQISPDDTGRGCDRQWMSCSIQVISKGFFEKCKSLSWAVFETGSRFSRLEERAFRESGLISIHLPASVTVIGEYCFHRCRSLASITFDPASKFRGSEADFLAGVRLGGTEAWRADAFFDN